jgi:hypothetical protein
MLYFGTGIASQAIALPSTTISMKIILFEK